MRKIRSTLPAQTPFDIWTLVHIASGIISYWLTSLILKGQTTITRDNQVWLIWTCFIGFLLLHSLWELWETREKFHKLWKLTPAWLNPDMLFWNKKEYKGDSWSNCLVDTLAFIGGFWLGYALIGVPKVSPPPPP